jgi:DNA replication protein DnaC
MAELKALRLYGMANGFAELLERSGATPITSSQWLIEHLLKAAATDRAVRSVRYQMHVARFPVHRDFAGFDFKQSKVERRQIMGFATTGFTDKAENIVLISGTGTGKTHLATALGAEAITRHGKRARFHSTVDLVNLREQKKAAGRAGRLANQLMQLDLLILNELGYVPFAQSGGALLFHLLSKLYERTSVVITTNLVFAEWSSVFADPRLTTALLDRLTHHCHIVETGNDSYRFRHSSQTSKARIRNREQARVQAKEEAAEPL